MSCLRSSHSLLSLPHANHLQILSSPKPQTSIPYLFPVQTLSKSEFPLSTSAIAFFPFVSLIHMDNGEEFPNRETLHSEAGNGAKSLPKQSSRVPFTGLSQVDSDLALARTLQEQERAFMMLERNRGDDGEDESSEVGSFVDEGFFEEEEDDEIEEDNDESISYGSEGEGDHEFELDPYEDNEGREDLEEDDCNYQDGELDSEELSYEELIALGEVVGAQSKGLSKDVIASLPTFSYNPHTTCDNSLDECVICRVDYEEGEILVTLPCKHPYHSECINKWLQINKVCPICTAEVPFSPNKQDD